MGNFQQDNATAHTARTIKKHLKEFFDDHLTEFPP